jgi:hypothetical protein
MKYRCVIVTFALLAASSAAAAAFNQFVGFCDSIIDSGFSLILANPGGSAAYITKWTEAVFVFHENNCWIDPSTVDQWQTS